METVGQKAILNELFKRLTEPAKSRIKLYQIAILIYMDQILNLVINKFMFFRVKIEEKKSNLSLSKMRQSQIKLDILSKERIQQSLDLVHAKARKSFVDLQKMHENCKSHQETPELFCEPYIHNGFRPINQPYSYYALSLFTKHNETINAWSHYLGAMYTLYLAFTMDFSDHFSWPLLSCLITATIMFISSATAHLMHQKSHLCHMTCFLCDFGGISFNGYGAAFMQTFICSPVWYYKNLEPYLLPIIGLQSALCCLLNSIAQTKYKRPYPPIKRFLQFAPCGLLWLFAILPLFLNFFIDSPGENLKISYALHFCHIFTFLLGAAFFALDFPQRFFPGRLDFFGQGHNIFHVCIFFVVYFQFKACYTDFVNNRDIIKSTRQEPNVYMCFGSLILLVSYYFYMIRSFYNMIKHNFDAEGNLIMTKKTK
ncbi:unnamed protein product [Brachionus calyciflorus]|uniref:Uncharacterized protein n=1 Tax=Brachionus calyciflorus TaxID=104777 RepID=A0A814AKE9_9BILA|nr:unnamed protein product [Brachionus calyciflorus]